MTVVEKRYYPRRFFFKFLYEDILMAEVQEGIDK